ncbi:MAG: hypothetical protein VX619_01805 [bacterium]|nr:hypothetical protein [bacterium]
MILTLQLVIACSLVIYSGMKITEKGDQLEDVVGISAGIVGTVLLAATTSLPEFVATFSSIYYLNAPQLALGNIFGSNTFNLVILAILDLFFIKEIIYRKAPVSVLKALAVGQIMTGFALAGIYLNGSNYIMSVAISEKPMFLMSYFSLMILLTYLLTFKSTTESDPTIDADSEDEVEFQEDKSPISPTRLITEFIFFAILVVGSGIWLTYVCDEVAAVTGLGTTFIGSILLAFATSLPEATVCTVAAKLGAFHLVFGNVLGSNIFNLFILGLADFSTPNVAMLSVKDVQLNFVTGFGSLIMSSIVIFAMFYRGSKRSSRLISVILFAIYMVTFYIMFLQQQIPY